MMRPVGHGVPDTYVTLKISSQSHYAINTDLTFFNYFNVLDIVTSTLIDNVDEYGNIVKMFVLQGHSGPRVKFTVVTSLR